MNKNKSELGVIITLILLLVSLLVFVPMCSFVIPKVTNKVSGVQITTIDGCEYIINRTYYGFNVYTHKGNCTNSIHWTK
jgi:hypothetical protein